MPEIRQNDPLQDFKKGINDNSTDHTNEFDPEDIRANSSLSAVCYISILFFLPMVLRPDSRFARFHANQGLLCLILCALIGVVEACCGLIPVVGHVIGALIGLVSFGYFLFGFVNALNGKARELPFIGGISLIKY